MKQKEFFHLLAAVLILSIITAVIFVISGKLDMVILSILFSFLLIFGTVGIKKLIANSLDADVEHSIWSFSRYWFKPHHYLEKKIPIGIILPIFLSIFSLGAFKVPTLLTFEAAALKRRAAKRFGYYSYADLSDWHVAIIAASGIIASLVIALFLYLIPFDAEYFAIVATLYAFFNLIPISKLDGAQVFFGSVLLWTTTVIITLIFVLYAFIALVT